MTPGRPGADAQLAARTHRNEIVLAFVLITGLVLIVLAGFVAARSSPPRNRLSCIAVDYVDGPPDGAGPSGCGH